MKLTVLLAFFALGFQLLQVLNSYGAVQSTVFDKINNLGGLEGAFNFEEDLRSLIVKRYVDESDFLFSFLVMT